MTELSTAFMGDIPAALKVSREPWFDGLRYRLQRRRIDHELANGARANSSEHHHRRACELTSAKERHKLASGYERLLSQAAKPPPLSLAPVNWPGVRASNHRMVKLAERLRADPEVRVRGVALAEILLTDASSPLYQRDGVSRVPSEVRSALAEI